MGKDALRGLARRLYHRPGVVEIDDDAAVSDGPCNGEFAWVAAWVKVPKDSTKGAEEVIDGRAEEEREAGETS